MYTLNVVGSAFQASVAIQRVYVCKEMKLEGGGGIQLP
jgi:hypothetical protein